MFQTTNQTSTTVFLGVFTSHAGPQAPLEDENLLFDPVVELRGWYGHHHLRPIPWDICHVDLGVQLRFEMDMAMGKKSTSWKYTLWLWYPMISTYNWHCSPKYRWYRRMTKDEDSKELTILILCYAYARLCFIDSTSFNIFLLIFATS